jgi:uncharacterized protein GlcG (DUF336 family)
MRISLLVVLAAFIGLSARARAQAQVSISGRTPPLSAAILAAQTTVGTCKANGYDVTATVVDVSGTPQAVPGGVAFKIGDETIAGLGVGGSAGGDEDEVCAQAGVAEAAELLEKPI